MMNYGIIALVFFVSGFGWGQWYAERSIRQERGKLEHGKLFLSVPTNPEDAVNTLGYIKDVLSKISAERKSGEKNEEH